MSTNQAWFYPWDLMNKQRRYVGSGTYLCVVSVAENQEGSTSPSTQYPVMIGIKNK